ncbi:hypothetical protein ACFXA3_37910 [Streptomyces sp. NPDC059456]|uniref:hypothetical protein n=1 Tax=Streptomyces sp. NPDC059456 TaxID=3346838 RepID=UPI0036BF456A
MKTLPATDGQTIGLGVTGHAGYASGALKSAKPSYAYDGGEHGTQARAAETGGRRSSTTRGPGRR